MRTATGNSWRQMIRTSGIILLSLFAIGNTATDLFGSTIESSTTILIEAESFNDLGGWVIDQQSMDQMGSPFLLAHGLGVPVPEASTEVQFPQTGVYHVWVRTRDWAGPWKQPDIPEALRAKGYPGKFQIRIADTTLKPIFGTENADWHWQDGGSVEISSQKVRVSLVDLTGFDGRCDAILFCKDASFLPPAGGRGTRRFPAPDSRYT